MGAGTNSGKGRGYGNRMPGPANIAASYPGFQVNSMAGGGPTLSADGGMGYNAAGPTGNLAALLAGAQAKPTLVSGGMQLGGGPLASERYGGFPISSYGPQKPGPGGKPAIGYGGTGGGKPRIGGMNTGMRAL